jgi:hypothetical protein
LIPFPPGHETNFRFDRFRFPPLDPYVHRAHLRQDEVGLDQRVDPMPLRPGVNVIKLFLSLIYGFSYPATVFIILDRKSLPIANTLAYYENL